MVISKARRESSSIAMGVLLIFLGCFAVILPLYATLTIIRLLGWLLIVAAVEQAVYAFRTREEGGLFLKVLLSAVYGVVALLLLLRPVSGAVAATAIIATLFLLDGVLEIALGFKLRRGGIRSGWLFIGGCMSLVFAAIVLYRFPLSAIWTLGLLVGIRLVVKGIEQITRSSRVAARADLRRAA